MKILVTGDFVIDQVYDSSLLNDNIISLFKSSDYNITNLEAPITDCSNKILKTGPHIKGNEKSTLDVLTKLNINAVTLANNHVLDYDEKGVIDTLKFCKENKIDTVGAGKNLEFAKKNLYLECSGEKVAIINFAENEWASATPSSAGSNPLDLIENLKMIREARSVSDYVIVIIHGGHEYFNLPSPRMQKQYRFFADEGADIVIGHHPHCVTGHEVYKGVPIYYSLGNFLFTLPSNFADWYTGLVLELELKERKVKTKLHVVSQDKKNYALNLETGLEADKVHQAILGYDEIIHNSQSLENAWKSFVNKKYESYLKYWSPTSFLTNRYVKAVVNRLGLNFLNKRSMAYQLNLMRCEAHHDLSKKVINKYLSKNDD